MSASASRRRCHCCWAFYRWRRLVVAAVVGFLLSVSSPLGVLSLEASCCCFRRRLVAVVVGGGGVLLLLFVAASRRSLKGLVYIRLTMHATNMDPQH